MRQADDARLVELVLARLATMPLAKLAQDAADRLFKGMPGLKERAKTIVELTENAIFYAFERPIPANEKARSNLSPDALKVLQGFQGRLADVGEWTEESLLAQAEQFATDTDQKLGKIAAPIRAALTGSNVSPSVFEIMAVLGLEETRGRLDDAINGRQPMTS